MFFYTFNEREREKERDWKYNYIDGRVARWRLHLPLTSTRMSKRGKNWRGRFRVDDETIRWWWGRVSIGSRGCVLEVTEMDGNKAICPSHKKRAKSKQVQLPFARWRNRRNNYRARRDEVCNSVRSYRTCNCFGSNNVQPKKIRLEAIG